jgi:hypothetical protein
MMWIDIGVTLLLALRTTLLKPSPPRLLELGYEASPAERGNEETVVRKGEVDNYSPFAKVLHFQKPRRLQLHIYVMRSSERPR